MKLPTVGISFVCLACATVIQAEPPPRSGSITWLRDGATLAVANLDADSVTLVGTDPFSKLDEIVVGQHPRSVAAGRGGKTLFVSLPETDQLVWVDLVRRRKVGELQIPGGPFAILAPPPGREAIRCDSLQSPHQRGGYSIDQDHASIAGREIAAGTVDLARWASTVRCALLHW